MIDHTQHLFQYDGIWHWCFLIALLGFLIGMLWIVVRVLLPLHRLTKATESIMQGDLPAFSSPLGGIREIDRLRRSLQYMTAQIRLAQEREILYRAALTDSQENERKRIAREIHDDTIQSLVLVAHSIERTGQAVAANHVQAITTNLREARQQVVCVIDSLRHMISHLRPTVLDELGLVTAIETLCESCAEMDYRVVGEVYDLTYPQELAIFRATQEAIRNAESHAQANKITVTLMYYPTWLTLNVNDDGVGFQVPRQLQEFAMCGHYGLIGIHERVHHLGGQLHLASDTSGTRVMINLPRSERTLAATG